MNIPQNTQGESRLKVTHEVSAAAVGSGLLPVFATPMMINLMEQTCHQSVAPFLENGQSTVGTLINVSHSAATPIGMEVVCKSTLVMQDRRRLVFEVEAFDEQGSIGKGTHERFIVENEKFLAKVNEKMQLVQK